MPDVKFTKNTPRSSRPLNHPNELTTPKSVQPTSWQISQAIDSKVFKKLFDLKDKWEQDLKFETDDRYLASVIL